MKCVCVIDGQGGGIGAAMIKSLKAIYGESIELIGLGANAIATAQMHKAGANKVVSGEEAICRTVSQADCIIGPVGITWAKAMMGEIAPQMAEAVMASTARKILLPLNQENVFILGLANESFQQMMETSIQMTMEAIENV